MTNTDKQATLTYELLVGPVWRENHQSYRELTPHGPSAFFTDEPPQLSEQKAAKCSSAIRASRTWLHNRRRRFRVAARRRWIHSCRHELLDRTLVWNQRHLPHALREYEKFYNSHRHHQGIANARPLHPLPPPITDQAQITYLDIRRRQRLGGILNQYHHAA